MVLIETGAIEKYINVINHLGWKKFVEPPCYPVPSVVREFYANLDPRKLDSTVHGITVSYNQGEINSLYNLPHVVNDFNLSQGFHD